MLWPFVKMKKTNELQRPSGTLLDLVNNIAFWIFLSLGSCPRLELVHCGPIGAPANLAQALVTAWLKLAWSLICKSFHNDIDNHKKSTRKLANNCEIDEIPY